MSSNAELVTLASIVPPEDHEVGAGFDALVNGEQVRVRAVLERTVVVEHAGDDERSVVRKDLCMVSPADISFVIGNANGAVGPRTWRRLPGKPKPDSAPAPAPAASQTPT